MAVHVFGIALQLRTKLPKRRVMGRGEPKSRAYKKEKLIHGHPRATADQGQCDVRCLEAERFNHREMLRREFNMKEQAQREEAQKATNVVAANLFFDKAMQSESVSESVRLLKRAIQLNPLEQRYFEELEKVERRTFNLWQMLSIAHTVLARVLAIGCCFCIKLLFPPLKYVRSLYGLCERLSQMLQLRTYCAYFSTRNTIFKTICSFFGQPFENVENGSLEIRRIIESNDHYEVLSLTPNATCGDVKRAFHRLARKIHPDKNVHELSGEAFKRARVAYDILSNLESRVRYDKFRVKK